MFFYITILIATFVFIVTSNTVLVDVVVSMHSNEIGIIHLARPPSRTTILKYISITCAPSGTILFMLV